MFAYLKTIQNEFNLEDKGKNTLYGVVNGYEVTIVGSQTITMFLNFNAEIEIKNSAASEFKDFNGGKFTQVVADQYGISAVVNGWTGKSAATSLIEKLKHVTKYLNENEALGISNCTACGKELDFEKQTIKINDRYVTLDKECSENVTEVIAQENIDFENAPNNYVKGIIGAFIGALIGCVAWVIIYNLGYLSAITAILGVFLSDLLYVKFGGKSNNMKLVIISVINLALMFIAPIVVYYIVVQGVMIEENLTGNPFYYIFNDEEIFRLFIGDVLMNLLFTALGIGAKIFDIYRKNKANRNKVSR